MSDQGLAASLPCTRPLPGVMKKEGFYRKKGWGKGASGKERALALGSTG